MNWLDILFIVVIGWNSLVGFKTGIVVGLAKLLGVLTGLAAAFNFYQPLADAAIIKWSPKVWLQGFQGWGESVSTIISSLFIEILSFIVIYVAVSKVVVILGILLSKMAKLMLLGPIDRVGGAVLGSVKGVLIVAILVAMIKTLQFPIIFIGGQESMWFSLALEKSLIVPYFTSAFDLFNVNFPGWIW